jgi:hypothetical protein
MHPSRQASGLSIPESLALPDVGGARLLIGLVQGLLLYWLYRAGQDHAWPATAPLLFQPLLLVLVLAPAILVSSIGNMAPRRAALWLAIAAALIAMLGVHGAWRVATASGVAPFPAPALAFFLAAGFFIAHSMVMAGVSERRRIASYAGYFEAAWKLAVQLGFSGLFVGVTWLVLTLGAKLFLLVQITMPEQVLREAWFAIPISAFAFTWAMHITDVRPAIVRGIRTLLLVLMSWLLPVAALIVGAFLASLLFTGLAPLWATRHAAAVLLAAAATLVIMINAAWQNGAAAAPVPPVIRLSARAAALLLAPVTAIALYALALRVAEHGWTTDRVVAAACVLVAACYAAGYGAAALRKGWLDAIAGVNIATALLVLAVLLALFSPIADPARLSVNSQLARLASGRVAADKFDYAYLRFEGKRYGAAALARLKAGAVGNDAPAIRQGVDAALALNGPLARPMREPAADTASLVANLTVWPRTAQLPQSFVRNAWNTNAMLAPLPACLSQAGPKCDVFMLDLSGDGKPEVVVIGARRGDPAVVMGDDGTGQWQVVATLPFGLAGCRAVHQGLEEGRFRAAAPVGNDLDIDGKRIRVTPAGKGQFFSCPD